MNWVCKALVMLVMKEETERIYVVAFVRFKRFFRLL